MKKKSLLAIALLLLVGLTTGYVSSTYAKYTETLSGTNATATVAKWDFKKGTNYGFEISLPATADPDRLVGDLIAPGTSGTYKLDLDNTNSQVGVSFEITFDVSNVPSNLVFTDHGHSDASVTFAGHKITGVIPAGGSLEIPLEWEWPYETTGTLATEDAEDLANGKAASTMTLNATITGTQVDPQSATPDVSTASYSVVSAS